MEQENASESSNNETIFEDAVDDGPDQIDESIRQTEDEVNRTFSENPLFNEEATFTRPRPRSYQVNNTTDSKDDSDNWAEKWKNHRIPKFADSGLGIKDWANKVIFMIDFSRKRPLNDKEKCQLILENIPTKSFGPILESFSQTANKNYEDLLSVLENELQIDEAEASMSLANLKFEESRDKDLKRFLKK
ncbi:Oidioi.mRNA.OKI2018_I69.chrUn_3.g17232.t1.cds [Oikopleura dioica]|uniref:Oidioi.mRNA.OKI2018_I69.chrUn_3.g17232.t1.c ds n=1 Tax=Oikopleura dioica TaxID=34765 RepID=A0ABN7TGX1_OIKDI|nr:Oidioi.mRNA.OKI2018_I69.chrUn_3.g17232.t1.cds [Oikopleura dioica]